MNISFPISTPQIKSLKPTISNKLHFRGVSELKDTYESNEKYLLAFDLDGTFLLTDKQAMESFKALVKNKDHKLMFVTSRSASELEKLKDEYSKKGIDLPIPDYFISNDGQHIYTVTSSDEGIKMTLDPDWDEKITKFDLSEAQKAVEELTNKTKKGARESIRYTNFHPSDFSAWYFYDNDLKDTICKDLAELLKDKPFESFIINDYVEAKYVKKNPDYENIKHFVDEKGGCYAFCLSASNKASAVNYMQSKLNIKPDHIITAGDGGNDISLAENGSPFIMVNNAKDMLKDFVKQLSEQLQQHIIQVKNEGLAGINEGLKIVFSLFPDKK